MSAAMWRNQHNKHHATPQKMGHDVDLDTLPLVAFNKAVAEGKQGKILKNPTVKKWVRLQGFLFAPVSCLLVGLGWQLYTHPGHSLRTGRYNELASVAARYAVVAYVASISEYTAFQSLVGYLAYVWIGCMYIFCNFAVSHTHLPVREASCPIPPTFVRASVMAPFCFADVPYALLLCVQTCMIVPYACVQTCMDSLW